MSGPSNIKIQKTGAEEVGNAHVRWPASDLERSEDREEKAESLGGKGSAPPSGVTQEVL